MAKFKNTEIDDTGFFKFPVGTESERPSNPETGMVRWNSEINGLENYTGTEWAPVVTIPLTAEGGTVTDVTIDGTDYRIHSFTSTGTSTFSVSSTGTTSGEVDLLVVGGGGSGGTHHGGGGGAGGLVYKSNHTITSGSYTVTVGDGGNGVFTPNNNTSNLEGNPGQDSSFDGFLGRGGGGGIGHSRSSSSLANGGSGGGGANWSSSCTGGSATQPGTNPSADIDAGNDGDSTGGSTDDGGGGGGAGSAAGGGYNDMDGGAGINMSAQFTTTFGDDGWFAGGAGAGNYNSPGTNTSDTGFGNGGPNGNGGGGRGGVTLSGGHAGDNESGTQGSDGPLVAAIDGIDGTGGGGGGVPTYEGTNKCSGFGGSGIVLIRYRLQE